MLWQARRGFICGRSATEPAASSSPGATAAAFLARTSGLDITHQNAYTAFLNGLDSDSLTAKFDVLHVYATQDSTTALLNLVSASFNGTANGSPTFTADSGFLGVESSSTVYINTGFNPTSGTPNYTQNSAHISEWPLTDFESASGGVGSIGASPNNSSFMLPRYITGDAYFLVNNAQFGGYNTPTADSLGHFMASRTASNLYGGYKNGTSIIAPVNGSTTLVNQNFYGLAINNNGAALGAGRKLAMLSIGGALTAGEVTNFYNRLRTYMTAVGVP